MKHPIIITRWGKAIDSARLGGQLKLNWTVEEVLLPAMSAKRYREMMKKKK